MSLCSPPSHLCADKSSSTNHRMRIFASSDETGNVKEVVCSRGTDTSIKEGQQPELVQNILQKDAFTNVKSRIHGLKVFHEKYLLAHRLGGVLCVYEYFGSSEVPEDNYKLLHSYQFSIEKGDKPVSLVTFDEHGFAICAYESLKIFIVYLDDFKVEPLELSLPLRDQKEKEVNTSTFVHCAYDFGVFAYGGQNNDLQIVRLFDQKTEFTTKKFLEKWEVKTLFRAKNVPVDHLGMKVPIWITAILFTKECAEKRFHVITATKYGQIRRYNTAEEKLPVASYPVWEKALRTLNFANEEQTEIIVTDVHTYVAKLSLVQIDKKAHKVISASAGTFWKPSLRLLGKFSEGGNTGAVHGVDVCLKTNKVAFGGLDRYLRILDISTRKMLLKVYLGTQISSVAVVDEEDKTEEEKEEAEDDELWDELEHNSAPAIKKRKRNL